MNDDEPQIDDDVRKDAEARGRRVVADVLDAAEIYERLCSGDGREGSTPPENTDTAGQQPTSKRKSAMLRAMADEVMQEFDLLADVHGNIYRYDGATWKMLTHPQFERLIIDVLGPKVYKQTIRGEVSKLISLLAQKEDLKWGRVAPHEIPCRSGVLNLKTRQMRPHNREDYLEAVLPWDYDSNAECPYWQNALETWFPYYGEALPDPRAVALQQFAGYCLLPHAKFKRALFLKGPGDTGKSEAVWVLRQLVSESLCCSLGVEAMDDPRQRYVLQGKMLNSTTEISARALISDSGFKQLVSTEEPVLIDRKFHDPFTYTPVAKHVFATNSLPRVPKRSAEIFNRLLIVVFDRVLPDEAQAPDFRDKIKSELPGVFAWAIEGARALIELKGKFTDPPSTAAVLAEWVSESDAVTDWLEGNLDLSKGGRLPLAYLAQLVATAIKQPVSSKDVGRAARNLGLPVAKVRSNLMGRSPMYCILDHAVVHPIEFTARDGEDNL